MRKNRADCVHIMKSCMMFKQNGFDVHLITPHIFRSEYKIRKENLWDLYGIEKNAFDIKEMSALIWDRMGVANKAGEIFIQIQLYLFTGLLFFLFLFGYINKKDIIYSKSYIMTLPLIFMKKMFLLKSKIFFEKAEFNENKSIHKYICRNVDGVITINDFIRRKVIEEYNVKPKNVHKLHFASQFEDFENIPNDKSLAKSELKIVAKEKIAMYAGKIAPEMLEIQYILSAAELLPQIKFYFIGLKQEFEKYFSDYLKEKKLNNIVFKPFSPLNEFFRYLITADVLISYYDSFDSLSVTQRVPAKASLYLLSRRPVIMADLPSLREWWNDEQVYFIKPDSPVLLAEKIKYVLENPEEANIKANNAYIFAKENTYSKSYSLVSEFIMSVN